MQVYARLQEVLLVHGHGARELAEAALYIGDLVMPRGKLDQAVNGVNRPCSAGNCRLGSGHCGKPPQPMVLRPHGTTPESVGVLSGRCRELICRASVDHPEHLPNRWANDLGGALIR